MTNKTDLHEQRMATFRHAGLPGSVRLSVVEFEGVQVPESYYSLRSLIPTDLFDADRIRPPMEFRAGRKGESCEGVGRDVLNLSGFPLVADAEGPFGSAVSDSVRTPVTESTTRLVCCAFGPPGTILKVEELTSGMLRFNGGSVKETREL
jgi:hypothetical protein